MIFRIFRDFEDFWARLRVQHGGDTLCRNFEMLGITGGGVGTPVVFLGSGAKRSYLGFVNPSPLRRGSNRPMQGTRK